MSGPVIKPEDIDAIFESLPDDLPKQELAPGKATWIENAFAMVCDPIEEDEEEIKAEQLGGLEQAFWRAARMVLEQLAKDKQ